MFSALSFKVKCYLLLGLVVVVSAFAAGTYYHIKEIGRAEEKIKNYAERVDNMKALMEENTQLSKKVSNLQFQLNERFTSINNESFKIKEFKANEADTLLSNHITGVERLSIPVIVRHEKSNTGTSTSSDPRRPAGTERHELHPATAQFIIELTKRADRYTAERNQCVQLLNETYKQVNEYQDTIRSLQNKTK